MWWRPGARSSGTTVGSSTPGARSIGASEGRDASLTCGRRIRVMTIMPGLFHTPLFEGIAEDYRKALEANVPFMTVMATTMPLVGRG